MISRCSWARCEEGGKGRLVLLSSSQPWQGPSSSGDSDILRPLTASRAYLFSASLDICPMRCCQTSRLADAVDEAAFSTWCPTSQYRLPFWCPSAMVLSECLMAKPLWSKPTVAPLIVCYAPTGRIVRLASSRREVLSRLQFGGSQVLTEQGSKSM